MMSFRRLLTTKGSIQRASPGRADFSDVLHAHHVVVHVAVVHALFLATTSKSPRESLLSTSRWGETMRRMFNSERLMPKMSCSMSERAFP
jgi:hypothetical protein